MRKPRLTAKRAIRTALRATPVLAIAAIAVVGVPSALADQSAPTAAAAVTQTADAVTITNTTGEDAEAFWTRERMASAKPVDIALQGSPSLTGTSAGPTGPPGGGGGTLPGGRAPAAGPPAASSAPSSDPVPSHGTYPGPHSTWPWFGNYTRYPISTIGRLFFRPFGSTGTASCSAAMTGGGPGTPLNVVWTAGHCISNGAGGFHSLFSFCPSYNYGALPSRGCWGWVSATVPTDWHSNGNFRKDYGVIRTTSSNNVWNSPPGAVTGTLGFGYNHARDQHWMMFGYPAEAGCCMHPWDGNYIVTTAAEMRYEDFPGGTCSFPPCQSTNSIGSWQTRGMSGGPWLTRFNGGGYLGAPWINSNNSYTYCVNTNCSPPNSNDQNGQQVYGPYFDTSTCLLWKGQTQWPGTC